MFEELNNVIEKRVKEVMQFHLNGTEEEFSSAASAVMQELSAMGDSLSAIVSEAGGLQTLAEDEGREKLAGELTNALSEN